MYSVLRLRNYEIKKKIYYLGGIRDTHLLHINDLISFVSKAMNKQKSKYGIFNVGSSQNISIKILQKK